MARLLIARGEARVLLTLPVLVTSALIARVTILLIVNRL